MKENMWQLVQHQPQEKKDDVLRKTKFNMVYTE